MSFLDYLMRAISRLMKPFRSSRCPRCGAFLPYKGGKPIALVVAFKPIKKTIKSVPYYCNQCGYRLVRQGEQQ